MEKEQRQILPEVEFGSSSPQTASSLTELTRLIQNSVCNIFWLTARITVRFIVVMGSDQPFSQLHQIKKNDTPISYLPGEDISPKITSPLSFYWKYRVFLAYKHQITLWVTWYHQQQGRISDVNTGIFDLTSDFYNYRQDCLHPSMDVSSAITNYWMPVNCMFTLYCRQSQTIIWLQIIRKYKGHNMSPSGESPGFQKWGSNDRIMTVEPLHYTLWKCH
jgi:hypothetical protein